MGRWGWLVATMLTLSLGAQDLSKLPGWAEAAARAVEGVSVPAADAWVVLNRTEIAYTGSGEVRTRKYRLVKILGERGLSEASYWLGGIGGKASRVDKLKGWNLRPDGEMAKLDQDTVVATDTSSSERVSTGRLTVAVVPRAVKGSWIAFESQETFRYPTGPCDRVFMMEEHPVFRWELGVAKKDGWFTSLKQVGVSMEVRHFEPWIKDAQIQPGQSVQVSNLPPLPKDEGATPHGLDVLPSVLVRFQDPELSTVPPTQSWDAMAKWYLDAYVGKLSTQVLTGVQEKDPALALPAIHRWMSRQLEYRQVYLSPERGTVPERAEETVRKRYGDCKDLATLFMSEARTLGLKAYPALCRIVEGTARQVEPVFVGAFNHVIAAVRLEKSLGLSAEVETPAGRFLLVDATDRLDRFGPLPWDHRGRELMICTEKGAVWVTVPVSSTQRPSIRYLLEGTADPKGALDATLAIREEADGAGLRSACLHRGVSKIKEYILENLLDLPSTGTAEVLSVGDPLNLEQPFEVKLKLLHPVGFRPMGAEAALVAWGLPSVPNPIQKNAVPRAYPVEFRGGGRIEYEARVQLPWRVQPLLPVLKIDSPFRVAEWFAEMQSSPMGSQIRLRFSQQRKDAGFGFKERDHGVSEWKKDRSQLRTMLSDGLTFKFIQ